jgi:hypothetical protein
MLASDGRRKFSQPKDLAAESLQQRGYGAFLDIFAKVVSQFGIAKGLERLKVSISLS